MGELDTIELLLAHVHQQHKQTHLMTGDRIESAEQISHQLGIEHCSANLKPEDKLKQVTALQQKGAIVVMTGDGVNDAPVLAGADLSIAMGKGTQLAAATADMILISNNIVPALGHSNCKISDLKTLGKYSSKLNITHLYNAMSGISHKQSGLAMYPFLYKDSFFELNADSIHLSDEIIKMSYEYLNHEKLILISDAVISAGSDFGEGEYCGIPVVSDDTGVRYKDSGTLIGSNKLLPEIITNFIRITGAPVHEAVKFATINPARLLGVDGSLGSIKIGKASDLVIFDGDFRVKRNLKGF